MDASADGICRQPHISNPLEVLLQLPCCAFMVLKHSEGYAFQCHLVQLAFLADQAWACP